MANRKQYSRLPRSSSGHGHPYMRGFRFWNDSGAFWRNNYLYSESTKQKFETWLENMRLNERSLTKLTGNG